MGVVLGYALSTGASCQHDGFFGLFGRCLRIGTEFTTSNSVLQTPNQGGDLQHMI
jgi:hypothetical protein